MPTTVRPVRTVTPSRSSWRAADCDSFSGYGGRAQATDSNARGSLTGAELLDGLAGLFTGTSQDASKSHRTYWDRALAALGPRTVLLESETFLRLPECADMYPCR